MRSVQLGQRRRRRPTARLVHPDPRRSASGCPMVRWNRSGQEVVLGRAPSVSKVSGSRIPRLVTIGRRSRHPQPRAARSRGRHGRRHRPPLAQQRMSPSRARPVKLRAGEPTPRARRHRGRLRRRLDHPGSGRLMRRARPCPSCRATRRSACSDPAASPTCSSTSSGCRGARSL